jgi:hypothetical protein
MVTISVMWCVLAGGMVGGGAEGTCRGPGDACLCHPVPPSSYLIGGFTVGVPTGIGIGAIAGWLASRMRRHRRMVLLVIAIASASLMERITQSFMHCSTDPDPFALWITALVPLVLAALALDRD